MFVRNAIRVFTLVDGAGDLFAAMRRETNEVPCSEIYELY